MPPQKDTKEQKCAVSGCSAPAVRSVNAKRVAGSGLSISEKRGNVNLCKEHYRAFKKSTKEERELQRLGW